MIDFCEADQVIKGARQNAPSSLEKLDLSWQYEFIVSNIDEAKGLGLRSLNGLILYNVAVLTVGKSSISESQWSNLMNAVKSDPPKFSELVLLLADDALSGKLK